MRDGAVRRHPTRKREGWALWPRIEEETILSLFLGWALTLLSSSLSTANLYGRRKKPTTHRERERERILDTVGRCYQGEHTHTTTHTLSNSALLTHISFSIFCGQWRRPPIVSIGRMCAAAVAVVRSSPGPPLIKATHAACE